MTNIIAVRRYYSLLGLVETTSKHAGTQLGADHALKLAARQVYAGADRVWIEYLGRKFSPSGFVQGTQIWLKDLVAGQPVQENPYKRKEASLTDANR